MLALSPAPKRRHWRHRRSSLSRIDRAFRGARRAIQAREDLAVRAEGKLHDRGTAAQGSEKLRRRAIPHEDIVANMTSTADITAHIVAGRGSCCARDDSTVRMHADGSDG